MGGAPQVTASELQEHFRRFATTYPDLPLYRRICEGIADDPEVASLLASARPGQARPVLLLAALHDLVLQRSDLAAARWYPSVTDDPPAGDPWPDVRAAALGHADELRAVVASRSTQTNEVNRAVHLGCLLAEATSDLPDAPVVLLELGASAGLLLELDRYRIEVGDAVLGDPRSPVRCRGELLSGRLRPGAALPRVVERVGLDLDPVGLGDEAEVRWLEACLWPDQPDRLARFRAAVLILRDDPPDLVRGDMVDDLEPTAHAARAVGTASAAGDGPVHLVVMSSWALTYVRRDRRPRVAEALAALAADGRPVSWITAEPRDCVPGLSDGDAAGSAAADDGERTRPETVLGARRWRDGAELAPAVWGESHPHGTELHWTATG
jgi:hypothetical protein